MRVISFLLIFLFYLISCSGNEKLNIKLPFVTILKRASLDLKYPKGFLQMGLMIEKEGKGLLNTEKDFEKIKSIRIINQEKTYIIEKKPFGMKSATEFNGYIRIGDLKQYMFIFSDFSYNEANAPRGVYKFIVEDIHGNLTTRELEFNLDKSSLEGYPKSIKVDIKTMEVSWRPITGATSYRIYVFKGDKGIVEDWSSLVYDTSYTIIPNNKYLLPKDKFDKGKYYLYVEAYNPPFFNLQDRDDEIGYFNIE